MCLGTTLSSMDMKTIQMWALRLNIDNPNVHGFQVFIFLQIYIGLYSPVK